MSRPTRTDLPASSATNFSQRVRETLMTYLGRQGDPLDRGLTIRDLVMIGLLNWSGGGSGGGTITPGEGGGGGTGDTGGTTPDLTPPPQPTGFQLSAAISHVLVEHDNPLYTQGHGHLRTHVYGVIMEPGDPLPTFTDAVEVGQFSGTVWALDSNPSTTWRLWIKWETNDGVLSATPAGGANGLEATTGENVAPLIDALAGQITESELYSALNSRLNLIDGNGVGSVNARVAQEASVRATETGSLFAKYTVKIDVNGYVTGYGLASTANNATPFSEFAVRANQFYIASPSGPGIAPAVPFIVRTTPGTLNGQTVPVGVYMTDAFLQNGTISNAKIGTLAVDNAKIASVSADKITAGTLAVGQYIQSSSYVPTVSGWRINGNGSAELANVTVRGTVYAYAGEIGGTLIYSGGIQSQNYVPGTAGWQLNSNGDFHAKTGTFSGDITGATGTFSGTVNVGRLVFGAFASYAWPQSGTGGYFGPGGLLLGNANTGRYFQVTDGGDLYAPGFSVVGGTLQVNQANVINTLNIAGNAVTIPLGADIPSQLQATNATSTVIAQCGPFTSQGGTVFVTGYFGVTLAAYSWTWRLVRNGVTLPTPSVYSSSPAGYYHAATIVDTPGAGSVTYQIILDVLDYPLNRPNNYILVNNRKLFTLECLR